MGRDGEETKVGFAERISGWRKGGILHGTYSWLIHICWNADRARGPVIVSSSGAKGG